VGFPLFGARCCSATGLSIGPFAVAFHRFAFLFEYQKNVESGTKRQETRAKPFV
jgi:hypothetical protein